SAACLVDTDAVTLFLKRHPERLRSAADLTVEHGFMAHLQRGGVAVPHVLRDAAGSTALAEAGWTYELHAAAPGADLYR
ncbi:phosphotransferase, partial [Campylobacter jejuni]